MSVIGVSANANPYVQTNVGLSTYSVGNDNGALDQLDKKGDMGFRVAVGNEKAYSDFNIRYAVDYTHFGTAKGSTAILATQDGAEVTGNLNTEVATQSLGVSVISEFLTGHVDNIAPYAGVRLAANSIEGKVANTITNQSAKDDVKKFGLGGIVGVQYTISPQLSLDLNAEYNRLGDMPSLSYNSANDTVTSGNVRVNQYGVNAGVRMKF